MNLELSGILNINGELSVNQIITVLIMAALIGAVIFISYSITGGGVTYSRSFNISLAALTVLSSAAMLLFINNPGAAVGVLGAVIIVRFRMPVKDVRSTVFLVWAAAGGICCGTQNYIAAASGSAAVFIILLILRRIKNDKRMLLIIKAGSSSEMTVEGIVFQMFEHQAVLRSKADNDGAVELIYELREKDIIRAVSQNNDITAPFYKAGNIEYVNIVRQETAIDH